MRKLIATHHMVKTNALHSIMKRLRDEIQRIITLLRNNSIGAKFIQLIHDNPLYKGVLVLGTGTVLAQLIGILSMPIITRLYTPSDLGVLAVYSSILVIIGGGATLRYEFAYSLPKSEEDAANIFGLCTTLLFITTIGLTLSFFFWGESLFNIFNMGLIEQYRWFLLVAFFGMGFYTILNYWAIRQRDYERITYTKINQGVGGAVSKIVLGILSFGPTGLIIGHIVSQIAGVSTLGRAMWGGERENLKAISLSGMKRVAKTYKSFPTLIFPASIVNTIALQLPPIMLLALYDSQIVGFYALANTLTVLPGSVISNSMGQAYLGEASKMVRERSLELRSLYVRTLKHLLMIAIPTIVIPALCAPFVVPIIFGEAWAEAGWYVLPLVPMVMAGFVSSPISFLHIYGYSHWKLMFDITRTIGVIIGFYMCQLLGVSVLITLTVYSMIIFLMYIIMIGLNLMAIYNFTTSVNKHKL